MSIEYTVVIPAYNAAETIGDAIDSIVAQTLPPTEIIVVDDGSTDATVEVVRSMRGPIRLIRQDNQGAGSATTLGISEVKTPLLATLDADDLWLPKKIQRQAEYLAAHPSATAVFTLARLFRGCPQHSLDDVVRLWTRTTMLIDTRAALAIGPVIDPPGGRGDIIDWLAKCREKGYRTDMVEEVLALRRIRPGSVSYGRDATLDKGYLFVVHRALQRKRQASQVKEKASR